ncbi:AOX, alternative oxidase mitochondrial precursor [Crepidotus variabilis]|uniref:Alternative oxidase n=1 Tax=Crepidotus variabilis TaxID=179855 RepID=A0A9P6EF15_9AGAR|nr:AOX, alternative oxidase mitochondrial precursor [Crepidotus variabilis]
MIYLPLLRPAAPGVLKRAFAAYTISSKQGAGVVLLSGTAYSGRYISTASPRSNSLTAAKSHQLTVEPHKQDKVVSSSETKSHISKEGAGDVAKQVRGDWVLFHPVYSPSELKAVQVLHRKAENFGDKAAYGLVKLARSIFDFVSGYKHVEGPPDANASLEELRKTGYMLSDKQWLSRILFLESIAGVPGMVAATLRHLQSLRLMVRDSGWIHTLLEEAENERMHLMTFMTLKQPSYFFRALVLGAQGVFYNLFFLCYLISPRICHRFVGYLEEEAVITYTRCIADLEAGRIPEWSTLAAPKIAIEYWRLHDNAKMLDVIYAVRSDETTHRFVNHSLANLNTFTDVNPFALREPDMHLKGGKVELTRDEADKYVTESDELFEKNKKHLKRDS